MTRRETGLAVVVGVVAGAFLALFGFGTGSIQGYVFRLLVDFWFVGVLLVVLAAVLARRHVSGAAPRILHVVGVAWVAFLDGFPAVYVVGYALSGPHGP